MPCSARRSTNAMTRASVTRQPATAPVRPNQMGWHAAEARAAAEHARPRAVRAALPQAVVRAALPQAALVLAALVVQVLAVLAVLAVLLLAAQIPAAQIQVVLAALVQVEPALCNPEGAAAKERARQPSPGVAGAERVARHPLLTGAPSRCN
jgi:hypothetical protein